MRGVTGGEELYELQDALKFRLGRLTLGAGNSIAEKMMNFVMTASEDDLYALIELIPQAQFKAHQKALREGRFPLGPPDTVSAVRRIIVTLNAFLEKYGSRAQFRSNGTLDREGSIVEKPRKLLGLSGRDALVGDLVPLLQKERPVGIIFLDLDSFKAVNEKFGHKVGDDCLERAVAVTYGVIGDKGKLYRYGKHAGDEFVCVLPNFSTSETGATAARLREAIEAASLGG